MKTFYEFMVQIEQGLVTPSVGQNSAQNPLAGQNVNAQHSLQTIKTAVSISLQKLKEIDASGAAAYLPPSISGAPVTTQNSIQQLWSNYQTALMAISGALGVH